MLQDSCGIYMLTNKITKERYIGQTINLRKRMYFHKNNSKKPKMNISKAIKEYGLENFEIQMLCECTREELDQKEKEYIAKLKPEYNVCIGGRDNGSKGNHLSDEQKEASRQAALKQWQNYSQEERDKIIKNNLKGPQVGHSVSQETREKLRHANLGKKQSKETIDKRREKLIGLSRPNRHRWRKVRCVETGEIFEQVKLAAQYIGVHPSCINGVLKGSRKTTGGYHWEYVS